MSKKTKEQKDAEKKAKAEAKALKDAEKNKGPKTNVEHRHISELNKLDREVLEAILRKDPSSVSEDELDILKAREAYLSSDERKKYL